MQPQYGEHPKGETMKNLIFIVISGLFFAGNVMADEPAEQRQPTLAALEMQQQSEWQLPEQSHQSAEQEKNQLDLDAQKLNAQIESELDARLSEKLNRQLQINF